MRDDMTGQLDNRLLFRFIGLAYESTKKLSGAKLDGSASEFLGRLYLRRLRSVFGEPSASGRPQGADLDGLHDFLRDFRSRRGADLLRGHVGDFRLDDPQTDASDRHGGRAEPPDHPLFDRQVEELGLDAYATYLPIHFFPEDSWTRADWGIYISEDGVDRLAEVLRRGYADAYGPPSSTAKASFRRVAFEVLLRHEMEHFKIESFALNAEMYRQQAVYVPYLQNVYVETYESDECLEEALANATVLHSRVIKKLIHDLYPHRPADWWRIIAEVFFDRQPKGYTNYFLTKGWSHDKKQKGGYAGPRTSDRRDAMNFLCNQIVTGQVRPVGESIPFFAFLPDNYFLRAESLVPIYVVQTLDEERSFINLRTPCKREWEWFLRRIGFEATAFGNGDHTVWRRTGFRSLTIDYHGKHLNERSFISSLRTLGLRKEEFFMHLRAKTFPDSLAVKPHGREPVHALA